MVEFPLRGSLEVRESGTTSSKPQLGTDIVPFSLAKFAFQARDTTLDGHSIANPPVSHSTTNHHNFTRRLVTKAEWFFDNNAAIAIMIVIVKI
jgi:hypothetical protein